jgi:hypothetical protein
VTEVARRLVHQARVLLIDADHDTECVRHAIDVLITEGLDGARECGDHIG